MRSLHIFTLCILAIAPGGVLLAQSPAPGGAAPTLLPSTIVPPTPVPATRPTTAAAPPPAALQDPASPAAPAVTAKSPAKEAEATPPPETAAAAPTAKPDADAKVGAAPDDKGGSAKSGDKPGEKKADDTKKPAKPPQVAARTLFGAVKTAAPLAGRAIGWYAKGCLAGGKQLSIDGPAWQAMRLSRNRNWGHPKLIALLERFATEMKTKENWPGLLVGDISQPRGGPMLTGHKSHQVGLDADIWFKPKPAKTLTVAERETYEPLLLAEEHGKEVIAANWNDGFARLVKRAASYPEVERIFVHPAIKKKFCEVSGSDKAWLRKVRPMWLHNYHFHVRINCPAGSGTCEKQPPVSTDDGCGKELDDWIKMVSRVPKSQPKPPPTAKPAPPQHEITLAQLPAECKAVLAAGDPAGTAIATEKTEPAKEKTATAKDKGPAAKKKTASAKK